jgi:hypothetical protein
VNKQSNIVERLNCISKTVLQSYEVKHEIIPQESEQHPFEQLFMHDLSIVETRFDYDLTKLEPVGK